MEKHIKNHLISLTNKNRYNAEFVLLQFYDHDGLQWQLAIHRKNQLGKDSDIRLEVILKTKKEEKKVIQLYGNRAISKFAHFLFQNIKWQQTPLKFHAMFSPKRLILKRINKKNAVKVLKSLL